MVAKDMKDEVEDPSSDLEKELKHGKDDESDNDTVRDSVSSQGDSQTTEDDKIEKTSKVPKKLPKKDAAVTQPRASRTRKERLEANKTQKALHSTPTKSAKSNKGNPKDTTTTTTTTKSVAEMKTKSKTVPPRPSSESSEGFEDKPIEEVKEIDTLNDASNGSQSVATDDETSDVEANGVDGSKELKNQKIEEMELRIEKLEEELREVAALEVALYSVVPEHGSSSHKVHTPARRLSRIYIHACKHWTQDKRGTVARNTVSGLVLIAKSCGNDVPRLTFWLSNTVVLREIISQAFGNTVTSTAATRAFETNGSATRTDGKFVSANGKSGAGIKQMKKIDFMQFLDDWQETRTYIAALEKVEAWIFSRIVESVWWQSLTPHMQSPTEDSYSSRSFGRTLGPSLGDQQQGCFSINLWTNAFQDAFQRLCPLRAGGHKCGCLPVLAKMVMEKCVARLDVAMFNAILRESASDIPTDPISDPILDSKVLPIPAGDLSFGSGAQLKNSIGNWSRWLTDLFGMDTDESPKAHVNIEDDDGRGGGVELKSFRLLNALSDLLMLPKDMLMDRSIRKEVCPSIGLPLVKRILCNFTPDEFCPDPVPGAVLEALNAESVVERRLSGDTSSSCFPFTAAPVLYTPPSSADVEEKVADIGGKPQLEKNVSIIQRKGYTSDEELDELDTPLTSIMDKMGTPRAANGNGNNNGRHDEKPSTSGASLRYKLLREVWSV